MLLFLKRVLSFLTLPEIPPFPRAPRHRPLCLSPQGRVNTSISGEYVMLQHIEAAGGGIRLLQEDLHFGISRQNGSRANRFRKRCRIFHGTFNDVIQRLLENHIVLVVVQGEEFLEDRLPVGW